MQGTATRIELYPHLVRIVSPGGLPEPVTVENIRETQAARNYRVITVLRRLGLAEDAGRGVDVMVESMLQEMLEPPVFEDSGHSVSVALPIRSAVAPAERAWVREVETRGLIEPGDRILLVYAARGERLTNSRVRELGGLDATRLAAPCNASAMPTSSFSTEAAVGRATRSTSLLHLRPVSA